MDAQYDLANDAWAKGEVENFSTESFPGFKLFLQNMSDIG